MATFAETLIQYYDIKPSDILIGHSFGGYTAHGIRQLIGCEACQIASFTDTKKILREVYSPFWNHVLALLGALSSKAMRDRTARRYAGRTSQSEVLFVMDNFKTFRRIDLAKFNAIMLKEGIPYEKPPSLRIHSVADIVVRPPEEPYIEVPGDHFNLITHSEEVGNIVKEWLETQNVELRTENLEH